MGQTCPMAARAQSASERAGASGTGIIDGDQLVPAVRAQSRPRGLASRTAGGQEQIDQGPEHAPTVARWRPMCKPRSMRVLLGISGGIAAYKTPDLVRGLRRAGHEVRCAATANGLRLVSAEALAAVSGHPVAADLWSDRGDMPHIDLARWAEAVVVAPATADLLARASLGLADDLLTTLLLAVEDRVGLWMAPAMNSQMWGKAIVQQHVAALRGRGVRIIEPVAGLLACGEQGVGAMADPAAIVAALGA